MANYLAQFQTIKNSCDHLVIAVEDVSDLWPTVKGEFEERLPFKRACLNNKTRNPVFVEKLHAEYILTTDSRLRSRFPQEQSLFWFREPYATIVLVTCEDLDEFKTILKPRLKLIVQNDEREWFIVFVSRAHPNNDQATKSAKKVYAKLEVEFSSKKRERCCKLDIQAPEANFWEDLETKIMESIRNTLDKRVQFYEDEIRKLSEQRFMPVWNFCNFFILKESLAFMFEMAHLYEDALREYDELELCYLETGNITEYLMELMCRDALHQELPSSANHAIVTLIGLQGIMPPSFKHVEIMHDSAPHQERPSLASQTVAALNRRRMVLLTPLAHEEAEMGKCDLGVKNPKTGLIGSEAKTSEPDRPSSDRPGLDPSG